MRDTFRGQIYKGEITFGTQFNRARFAEFARKNERKRIIITIDEPMSTQLRRFFEGAVVPYYSYQQHIFENSKKTWRRFSIIEARENLKLEFNPVYLLRRNGEKSVVAGSTAKLNKAEFNKFLKKIQDWFEANGYLFPDSEDYKKWRDTSPLIGEIYPPLKKLIKLSDENLIRENETE